MRDYSQIISRMTSTVWLMEPRSLAMMVDIINQRLSGDKPDDEEIRVRIESADTGTRDISRIEKAGGVGIVPMYGPIFPKANLMTEVSGATSLEGFKNDLLTLAEDDEVKTIILDIDSPGGSAEMVAETGELMREIRQVKPIIAVANTMAGSAAYWLGAQASELYATKSGKVGSIGVYTILEDRTKADESEGIKVNIISAGKYKTAGNPHEELSTESREYIQEFLNETYDEFIDAVAKGRSVDKQRVSTDWAEGKVFSAKSAHKLGMVDGVRTLDDVVGEQLARNSVPNRSSVLVRTMHTLATANANSLSWTVPSLSSVEYEHSDPGTGNPPIPREQESDLNTERGSRIDTPPPAREEVNMEEFFTRISNVLGLSEPLEDEEAVIQHITALNNELQPLREADAAASSRITFREQFPEEAARMERLEAENRENAAKDFSARYHRFIQTEGEGPDATKKPTNFGFSALVLDMVKDAHLKLATKQLAESDLADLLDHIADGGIVEYKERGSSRNVENTEVPNDTLSARQMFADKVKELMESDNLTRSDAVKLAAEQNPELYSKYREPVVAK